jgi:hypothetical protein
MEEMKMITIRVVHKAKSQLEYDEFLKSLSFQHASEYPYPYEVIAEQDSPMFEEKNISRVKEPSADSKIIIDLPDDCIVLGNSYNRYVKLAIEEGLPQYGQGKNFIPTWEGYVQRRMGLQSRRPPEGIFPDLKVTLATQ